MKITLLKLVFLTVALCGISPSVMADGKEEPIPSYYEEPGQSRNREYTDQHANERIDPFTGKLQWHYTDIFIPGNGGQDIQVKRSYTALNWGEPGSSTHEGAPLGLGWTMHFGRIIRKKVVGICNTIAGTLNNPVIEFPDGGRRVLYVALDGITFVTTDFWRAECGATGGLTVHSPDGTRYDMTTGGHEISALLAVNIQSTWYTTKITDRNGNFMDFTYTYAGGNMVPAGA